MPKDEFDLEDTAFSDGAEASLDDFFTPADQAAEKKVAAPKKPGKGPSVDDFFSEPGAEDTKPSAETLPVDKKRLQEVGAEAFSDMPSGEPTGPESPPLLQEGEEGAAPESAPSKGFLARNWIIFLVAGLVIVLGGSGGFLAVNYFMKPKPELAAAKPKEEPNKAKKPAMPVKKKPEAPEAAKPLVSESAPGQPTNPAPTSETKPNQAPAGEPKPAALKPEGKEAAKPEKTAAVAPVSETKTATGKPGAKETLKPGEKTPSLPPVPETKPATAKPMAEKPLKPAPTPAKPAPELAMAEKPAVSAVPSTGGPYTVQVGSYMLEPSKKEPEDTLRRLGYTDYHYVPERRRLKIYHVFVGKNLARDQAQQVMSQLEDMGYSPEIVSDGAAFKVKVYSYGNSQVASSTRGKLVKAGMKNVEIKSETMDVTLDQLRAGKFATRTQAQKALNDIKRGGLKGAIIVKE